MINAIFWGAVLRFCQSLLQAAPFILVGLFVAGVLQRMLGSDSTRRLFGGRGLRGLIQSWAIGMLLPVCSLGVIPICREMRRAGLPGGTILAFALAAPLFNPLSLLYGLTLSEPFVILAFAFCSLIVITIAGLILDYLYPEDELPQAEIPTASKGLKRLLSIVVFGARETVGASAGYMLIGLLGVALLAVILPPGSLQRQMNGDNWLAPLMMSAIAIPAYATPMLAMSQLGMMFQHGNSVGAAFVLLALGAGMNIGLVAWTIQSYGWKLAVSWLGMLVLIVVSLSYGIERPLFPQHIEVADHTHAFDVYCQPFPTSQTHLPATVVSRLYQDAQLHEVAALSLLGFMVLVGLVLKVLDRKWNIESWIQSPPASNIPKSAFDVPVPSPILGVVALLALVAFSVVGCFAYYPDPREVFEEIKIAKTEALQAAITGNHEQAKRWIDIWDDWTRKLQVSVYLRRGALSDYHRMKARVVRDKLELLEHESSENETEEIRKLVADLSRASTRLQQAYLEEL